MKIDKVTRQEVFHMYVGNEEYNRYASDFWTRTASYEDDYANGDLEKELEKAFQEYNPSEIEEHQI